MNGMWVRDDPTEEQIDWLKILTHGVFNPWEVEGDASDTQSFYSSEIRIERDQTYSEKFNADGVSGIKTYVPLGPTLPEETRNLLRGPFVYQDQNYKTGDRFTTELIPYRAKFRMKIGFKPDTPHSIGDLRVILKYPTSNNTTGSKLLASTRFNTNDLEATEFTDIELPFTIEGLPGDIIDQPFSGGVEGIDAMDIINTRVIYEINLDGVTSPVFFPPEN